MPAPDGVGLGTMDQAPPSQCSMSVPTGFPLPELASTVPTAQQSEPLTHETSKNPPPSPAGSGGCGSSAHTVPFHDSTSGENDPLVLMFWIDTPTAQHCRAFAQVDPSSTSSPPVPGTVATDHPPMGAAAPTCSTTEAAAPVVAADNESASAAIRRCRLLRWTTPHGCTQGARFRG